MTFDRFHKTPKNVFEGLQHNGSQGGAPSSVGICSLMTMYYPEAMLQLLNGNIIEYDRII